ncbi:hemerythrin domain-containing protein [Nocardioides perillae]|uniref:Iron-sulfur cluster repair protein YtfE (RIC family) n=1 Tax=Nocardioides perillae TaxID=1119534 RepID=A0A7Y9UKL0_9ACTN|nr:iron-sulfur cluster repair protein YtfE (RIC family) [Nocardioides perillae]
MPADPTADPALPAALPTWDDAARPTTTAYAEVDAAARAHGDHLRLIHDVYRDGLRRAAEVLGRVADGTAEVGEARSALHDVGLRAAYDQLGSFCGQLCRGIEVHHRIEDAHLYPALRAADEAELGAVLDRLVDEHDVVHALLLHLDEALLRLARPEAGPGDLAHLRHGFDHLVRLLESHFRYEEEQLGGALGVHRVPV